MITNHKPASQNDALERIYQEIDTQYHDLDLILSAFDKTPIGFLPTKQRWKLFLDRRVHHFEDPYYFDAPRKNHPSGDCGNAIAMGKAYLLMLRTMDMPLSLELIAAIHDMLASNMVSVSRDEIQPYILGYAASEDRGFVISTDNATTEGIEESLKEFKQYFHIFATPSVEGYIGGRPAEFKNNDFAHNILNFDNTRWKGRFDYTHERSDPSHPQKTKVQLLQEIIQTLQTELTAIPQTMHPYIKHRSVIKAATRFAHSTELLHVMHDLNTRTFSIILLNRILLAHQMPPTMLWNPNQTALFSVNQICVKVIAGMQACIALTKKKSSYWKIDLDTLKHEFERKLRAQSATAIQGDEKTSTIRLSGDFAIKTAAKRAPFRIEARYDEELKLFEEGKLLRVRRIPGSYSFTLFFAFIRAVEAKCLVAINHYLDLGLTPTVAKTNGYFLLLRVIELDARDILKNMLHSYTQSRLEKSYSPTTDEILEIANQVGRYQSMLDLISCAYHYQVPSKVSGFNALHWAILFRHLECAKILFSAGAKALSPNYIISPLELALALDFQEFIEPIMTAIDDPIPAISPILAEENRMKAIAEAKIVEQDTFAKETINLKETDKHQNSCASNDAENIAPSNLFKLSEKSGKLLGIMTNILDILDTKPVENSKSDFGIR